MELLGPSLLQRIQSAPSKCLPVGQIRKIALQLVSALHFMKSRFLIHADIKPENVLMTPDNHVTLIDFGLARQLGAETQEQARAAAEAMAAQMAFTVGESSHR